MTINARTATLARLAPEGILTLLVLAGLGGTAHFYFDRGFLPQPFVFDVGDTFMDWFNTAQYAHVPGAFTVWHTVYPPLSFLFLKIFGVARCYGSSPFHARDCDWLGRATIDLSYLADVALAFRAFRRADPLTAPLRGTAFALGLPLLFTLERGNLILPCLAFFIVAHGPATRSRAWRMVAAAMTINFKPYLVIPVFAAALNRKWRTFELTGIAAFGLYLLTLAMFGSGTPAQLYRNTVDWVQFTGGQVWEQLYYSTSYAPFLDLQTYQFPIRDFVLSRTVDLAALAIPIVIRIGEALTALCVVGAFMRPGALTQRRLATVLLTAALTTTSPGGYTEVFVVFLVFLERWRRAGPIVAISAAYFGSVPYDFMVTTFVRVQGNSWLSGHTVEASFGLAIGSIVRPGLIVIILWALALDSLVLIARAERAHRRERPAPMPSRLGQAMPA